MSIIGHCRKRSFLFLSTTIPAFLGVSELGEAGIIRVASSEKYAAELRGLDSIQLGLLRVFGVLEKAAKSFPSALELRL